ncbi:MAG: MmgE/PrpD family protein, partial [Acetobacteraceae bacterium]|nr:MmgE/PrpD family protein [Acetobacteraceae bacterium]
SGLRAAMLAARGFTGIEDVLEASYGGFLSAIARTPKPERLLAGLGESWETLNVGFKMYPSVTSIHSALDALRGLMAAHALTADSIERIEVGVGHMTFVHTAWPYRPQGVTAAQMNMFFGLAAIALGGDGSAADYRERRLADPAILGFIPRIAVHEDSEIEAMGPAFRHACHMVVHTRDGRALRQEVLHRRASPENPVGAAEVAAKFRTSVRDLLSRAEQDEVIGVVAGLETQDDLAPLGALLGAAR